MSTSNTAAKTSKRTQATEVPPAAESGPRIKEATSAEPVSGYDRFQARYAKEIGKRLPGRMIDALDTVLDDLTTLASALEGCDQNALAMFTWRVSDRLTAIINLGPTMRGDR